MEKNMKLKTKNYTDNMIEGFRQDYIRQATQLFGKTGELRNLDKLKTCEFVLNERLGDGAATYLDENKIEYGPLIHAHTFYHELNHLRQGDKEITGGIATSAENPKHVAVIESRKGIFLDEGLTDIVARYMYKYSAFYNEKVDKAPMNAAGKYYEKQRDICVKFADALGLKILEFSRLVDLNLRFEDKTLDKMCEKLTGDKDFYAKTQALLDFFGTVQFAQLQCAWGLIVNEETGQYAVSCDQRSWDLANDCLTASYNRVAHLKKLRLQQAKSQQPQSEKKGFFR